jgi:hypothetical protein
MINEYGVEMVQVSSSNVQAVGYDDNSETLYVQFLNNSMYTYSGVPRSEFEALRDASSVGSYLHRNIMNSYPYTKLY